MLLMISVYLSVCLCVCPAWPNGLCIDVTDDRLYWADAKLDHIEMSDINGEHRVVLVRQIHHPFRLAVVRVHLSTQFSHQHTLIHSVTSADKSELLVGFLSLH